ncbi:MAG: transposase [Bacteroidetes bacterium GWA2_30_7]|nr:MAG: transposase [Bacteroidetes bacterium GWA2_30_7]
MNFEKDCIYHVYNRGNNREKVFYNNENYIFFLKKIRKQIYPFCEILAYCLMPNHFHFLIFANEKTIQKVFKANQERNVLGEGFRITLSSYSQAINKQEGRVGSLFTQNTEAKQLNNNLNRVTSIDYVFTCFNYIHQNPIRAGLVEKLEDWQYSSFIDYCGIRNGTLCNQKLAYEIINFDKENFYNQSYIAVEEQKIKNIW